MRKEPVVLCPFFMAICLQILGHFRVCFESCMERPQLGAVCHWICFAQTASDTLMLIDHLENVEIAALRSFTAHVSSLAKSFQFGEISFGRSSQMLFRNLRELILRLGIAEWIHHLHQIIAQVHHLIKHAMVVEEMLV